MTDYGLDLAVIGNGRTAALLDPSSRIVWWCLPRYDSDPVFSRLLAGNEEKGFSDVLLDGFVETRSNYARNTAIVVTELIDQAGDHRGLAAQALQSPRQLGGGRLVPGDQRRHQLVAQLLA